MSITLGHIIFGWKFAASFYTKQEVVQDFLGSYGKKIKDRQKNYF